MKTVKAFILRISFLLVVMTASFVVVEAVLRVWSYGVMGGYYPPSTASADDFVVLTLGESTTAGSTPDVWPVQLEKKLRADYPQHSVKIVNKAIPGTNTSVLVGNLESQIKELRPDVIVSMMGMNDNYEQAFKKSVFIPGKKNDIFLSVRFVRLVIKYGVVTAESFYDLYISGDPADLDEKGSDFRINGEYELAEKYLWRSITLDAKNVAHYISLAILYRDMKRNREAENMLLIAQRIDPASDGVYTELGNFYRDNGELVLAEEMYNAAIRLNPESWLAYSEYGILTSWYLKNDIKAEGLYKHAIKLHPDAVTVYFELADIYRARKDWPEAIRLYQEVLRREPNNTLAVRELGKTELAAGGIVAGATVDAAVAPSYERLHPMTEKNYLRMIELAGRYGVHVVAMQYPLQPLAPLLGMLKANGIPDASVVTVDNQQLFENALKKHTYSEIFTDHFGGNFGHATPLGNSLIADNAASVIGRFIKAD